MNGDYLLAPTYLASGDNLMGTRHWLRGKLGDDTFRAVGQIQIEA